MLHTLTVTNTADTATLRLNWGPQLIVNTDLFHIFIINLNSGKLKGKKKKDTDKQLWKIDV